MIRIFAIPCLSSRPRDRGLRVRGMLDEGAVDFVVVRVVEVIELVGGEEGVLLRRWSCNEGGTLLKVTVL